MRELECDVCKKKFYGMKLKKFCSNDCYNKDRRRKRYEANKETRRKEVNRKYYLKTKYKLTKKYEIKQEEYKAEQKEREERLKECNRIWKDNNKEKSAEYRRKTRIKTREWFDNYKRALKCEVCGYNKCSEALDFHHKNNKEKEFNVGQGLNKYGKEKMLKEIKRCIVLCANCHRELHYEEKKKKENKVREEYLRIINQPKKIYYAIVEKELETKWFKELQDKAKYNLNRFGGNQYTRVDNGIKEKIDIKKILSKKIGIGQKTISRILQIYRRGTEEQKHRARTGESSVHKINKELKPTRYSAMTVK